MPVRAEVTSLQQGTMENLLLSGGASESLVQIQPSFPPGQGRLGSISFQYLCLQTPLPQAGYKNLEM